MKTAHHLVYIVPRGLVTNRRTDGRTATKDDGINKRTIKGVIAFEGGMAERLHLAQAEALIARAERIDNR